MAEKGRFDQEIDTRAIAWFGSGLLLTLIAASLGMWAMFRVFDAARRTAERPIPALEASARGQLPPEPRLQTSPELEYQALKAAEERVLSSYAWADPERRYARVPIERAMQLALESGLYTSGGSR